LTARKRKRPSAQGLEDGWKWALRGLGVVGFAYLLAINPEAPSYAYLLIGALLGLDRVIDKQIRVNRREREGGPDAEP
jgi:hypothetical protein